MSKTVEQATNIAMATGAQMTDWGWEQTGPVWAARAYAPRKGQDHLGLGSVSSDQILPMLSPGINVLTIHPRYWSFYSWVLDLFWAAGLPRTRASFREFYRPREALFAMACHVCDAPEHPDVLGNIVGSQRVRAWADRDEFDPHFDYIKEPLGGYGLYYRSTMEMMGAVVAANPTNGFPFDAPTPIGRALAAAFGAAVAGTIVGGRMAAGDLTAPVARADLLAFARAACLCQLRVADTFDLPLLQDLFLHAGAEPEARARRDTLRLVLDVSQADQELGIDQSVFRQLIYFRVVDASTYTPRRALIEVSRRWRIYQAREYFSFVFNRLFGWVVRRGLEESDDGLSLVPIERMWQLIDQALDEHSFAADRELGRRVVRADTGAPEFAAMLAAKVDLSPGLNEPWPRHDLLDEHALYEWCRGTVDDNETVVAMLALLLLLHHRFGTPDRAADLATDGLIARGGSLRIGMARFFALLNRRLTAGATLSALARWVIHDFVIVQHERVATNKLPDDTFRVRRVGDQLRFFVQEAPAEFNNSRFLALSTTVHELGLVSAIGDPGRRLSPAGRQLLREGDLPAGVLAAAAGAFEPTGAQA
jgi:hypothetical protein